MLKASTPWETGTSEGQSALGERNFNGPWIAGTMGFPRSRRAPLWEKIRKMDSLPWEKGMLQASTP